MNTIEWMGDHARLIDQTRLPREEVYVDIYDHAQMGEAIKRLQVRGAPAIGVAAAYGLALAALNSQAATVGNLKEALRNAAADLKSTRPTAVNLAWALERVMRTVESEPSTDVSALRDRVIAEAVRIANEDKQANRLMGAFGSEFIPDGSSVLTHCNAGALATAGYGTALGVIRAAVSTGKRVHVYVDETRPLLQGARLTAWELTRDGIPATLITDSMAGYFMRKGEISCVIVGADRIAANGDVANKIGTYTVAVLAKENDIPFYVAAPTSTVDLSLASGDLIPIEERSPEEVTHFQGVSIAPDSVSVANPAFDVTPHRYVRAIITEKGVAREPYDESLDRLVNEGVIE